MSLISVTLAQITQRPKLPEPKNPRHPWEDTTCWTVSELAETWDVTPQMARIRVKGLVAQGLLEYAGQKKYLTRNGRIQTTAAYK